MSAGAPGGGTEGGASRSALLDRLAPYPFAVLERRVEELTRAGRPPLNFGIGDPDLPPPRPLLAALREALRHPENHRYSSARGESRLREAIAGFLGRRFGVEADPTSEIVVLIGSKEGLVRLPRAILDPGAVVSLPDPGYPAYLGAAVLAGLRSSSLRLDPARGYRPDWSTLDPSTRLLYLNYPNNPTGAAVGLPDLREAVERARDGRFVLAYDNAYSEVTYGEEPAPSLLEVPGAREVGVEFHSLSKTFGVPGWRIGFAVGRADRIRSLVQLKSQLESGATHPMQAAAIAALELYTGRERPREVERSVRTYGRRLRRLVQGLRSLGQTVRRPAGGLYLWQPAPGGDGAEYAGRLLEQDGVLVTPGAAFGPAGAPYVRWAVTRPTEEIEEALRRLNASSASGAAAPAERPAGASGSA